MNTAELLKKVRRIEIKTRGLSSHLFSGGYHSAFKGRGMSFSEVRLYYPGDDVRAIDWNVTARSGEPYIKVFDEERENTVMLLVDVSGSAVFGSHNQFKAEYLTELCAVLAFSAIANNDKVGVMLFSDRIELYIPPKKGKQHILRIIREVLNITPQGRKTALGNALQYIHNGLKKRCVCFVLSDFLDDQYEEALRVLARKHDCIGIHCWDPLERDLPDVGVLRVSDAETGEQVWVDTTSHRLRRQYWHSFESHTAETQSLFRRAGADFLSLGTHQPYVNPLLQFFSKRSKTVTHG
ncbi:MAG: DUF58 domain-containing protein [Saprospiraceae bacterium]|nr:DUF58 domain-containing protein [Saprospiraceae bacterium]MCB0573561.1 DUF58 domain-containing protein [Saprospiraceae bacterium]MCB9356587.1 DUF58 domain-containing protein [Lewinellaceae bacterium]